MYIHTPSKITIGIAKFCKSINCNTPQYVQIVPVEGAIHNECFANVDNKISKCGGTKVLGWAIWEWKHVFFEAELHAVWKSPKGALVDVSPTSDYKDKKRLFLPDDNVEFTGKRINNKRKALRNEEVIQEFFSAFDEGYALLEKYSEPGKFGYASIPSKEFLSLDSKQNNLQRKLTELPPLDINSLCYCGSGLKYKYCCL